MSQLQAWVRRALWDVVPARPPQRRPRRCAAGSWSRSAFVVLGGGRARPLAADRARAARGSTPRPSAWPRCGRSARSPPVRCTSAGSRSGRARRRPVVTPIVLGLAPGRGLRGRRPPGARRCDFLDGLEGQVVSVLDYADQGSLPLLVLITAVNGIAEELFFRGAAYAAITAAPGARGRPWPTSSRRCHRQRDADLRRRCCSAWSSASSAGRPAASSAPILTHCTWSLTMLLRAAAGLLTGQPARPRRRPARPPRGRSAARPARCPGWRGRSTSTSVPIESIRLRPVVVSTSVTNAIQ